MSTNNTAVLYPYPSPPFGGIGGQPGYSPYKITLANTVLLTAAIGTLCAGIFL